MSVRTFASFAAPDIESARKFYSEKLGMKTEWVDDEGGPIWLMSEGGGDRVLVYPKPDHAPAGFTVLNLEVPNIERAVKELAERGVTFELYEGIEQDEHGISHEGGIAAAWFTDPAGNTIALVQM